MIQTQRAVLLGFLVLPPACGGTVVADQEDTHPAYRQVSGIYPHLATFNGHNECGIGAVVPWAGRLWWTTYPPHKRQGSNDKLYSIDERFDLKIHPESVGGTHAGRMIHAASGQLLIGPYAIDRKGNVRALDVQKIPGRYTAWATHLTDPDNKAYLFDMEGPLWEIDVHTLAGRRLFLKPVPGWHGKGAHTGQGRLVIANNGEWGTNGSGSLRDVPGRWEMPLETWSRGEEDGGVLAEPDGIFFQDGFESADMSATSATGFKWGPSNATSVVTAMKVVWNNKARDIPIPKGRDWQPKTGKHSLRTSYGDGKPWAEQRFQVGKPRRELWMRFWIRIPLNYEHLDSRGHDNGKWLALWMDDYSEKGNGPTIVGSLERTKDGNTDLQMTWSVGGHKVTTPRSKRVRLITVPDDRGRWMPFVLHAKAATKAGSKNGVIEIWRRWEKEDRFTKLDGVADADIAPPAGGPEGWQHGYLLGYVNSPFKERTEFLMDDFTLMERRMRRVRASNVCARNTDSTMSSRARPASSASCSSCGTGFMSQHPTAIRSNGRRACLTSDLLTYAVD
ncbi:MAG: hypothetical protein ACC628_08300 [Pirellulaceae bacterium]